MAEVESVPSEPQARHVVYCGGNVFLFLALLFLPWFNPLID